MFDIGSVELLVVALVALLVLGPERLPQALRTLGLWFGRLRRSFTNIKNEIEDELGMDDIRRQLHNEAVMEEIKRIEEEVKGEHKPDLPDSPSSGNSIQPPATNTTDNTPSKTE